MTLDRLLAHCKLQASMQHSGEPKCRPDGEGVHGPHAFDPLIVDMTEVRFVRIESRSKLMGSYWGWLGGTPKVEAVTFATADTYIRETPRLSSTINALTLRTRVEGTGSRCYSSWAEVYGCFQRGEAPSPSHRRLQAATPSC